MSTLSPNSQTTSKNELHKSKSQSPSRDNNNNEIIPGNRKKTAEFRVEILNAIDLITTLSSTFVCEICHCFMIDISTFPCGHMFCKFCGLSWLRLESTCPICQKETYKPFSNRCYEMDSVVDEFYPLLYQFYSDLAKTEEGQQIVKIEKGGRLTGSSQAQVNSSISEIKCAESIQQLRTQKNSSKRIHIHSPEDREKLRRRRRMVSEQKDILLGAPCTSILQKLATIEWSTVADDEAPISGTRIIVWLCLLFSLWNLMSFFHLSWFDGGIRTIIYAVIFIIAFNVIQMKLFENPEDAPDLLDFGFWEHVPASTVNLVRRNGNRSNTNSATSTSTNSSGSSQASSGQSESSSKGSNESFKDCEDGYVPNSQRELEQIQTWQREGNLDYEKTFKIAAEMVEVLQGIGTIGEE